MTTKAKKSVQLSVPSSSSISSSSSSSYVTFPHHPDVKEELRYTLSSSPAASDEDKLARLKDIWKEQKQQYLDKFVIECGKELTTQVTSYLLGLISLLPRREYANKNTGNIKNDASKKGSNKNTSPSDIPLQVFPTVAENILLLLESHERVVSKETDNMKRKNTDSDSATIAPHALKFHALHAFNRILEVFPSLLRLFCPLMLDYLRKTFFANKINIATQTTEEANKNANALASSSSSSSSPLDPSFCRKLLESSSLLLSVYPRIYISHSNQLLKRGMEMVKEILETQEKEQKDNNNKSLSPPLSPVYLLTLDLLDFLSLLLLKFHLRLPRNYPSVKYLLPKCWPLDDAEEGGQEHGNKKGGGDDDDDAEDDGKSNEDDEIDELSEEEDEEDKNKAEQLKWKHASRSYFTQYIAFNPVRKGVEPIQFSSPQSSSELFLHLSDQLLKLVNLIGRERSNEEEEDEEETEDKNSSPAILNDYGVQILSFIPYLIALDNMYGTSTQEEESNDAESHPHTNHLDTVLTGLFDMLQGFDFSLVPFSPSLANSLHQLLFCVENCIKYSNQRYVVQLMASYYDQLVNYCSEIQAFFPRNAYIKFRRIICGSFLSILYTLDDSFQDTISSTHFFAELFPLLANPLITSHLIYLLRTPSSSIRDHVQKKVLPQIMKGLLNTKTKQSPSMKTVQMILTSLGNVVCFTRAYEPINGEDKTSSSSSATLPLLEPYLTSVIETILSTMQNSPSGTGQVASLVLCRIVMAGYQMPEVQSLLPRILTLYLHTLNESLFLLEQSHLGDEYDEEDQDLISNLQYCILDMLHCLLQTDQQMEEVNTQWKEEKKKHAYWSRERFVEVLIQNEANLDILKEIVGVLVENTKKPIFFNDDSALRNSEIHLIKEIVSSHPTLFSHIFTQSNQPSSVQHLTMPTEEGDEEAMDDNDSSPAHLLPPLPQMSSSYFIVTLIQSMLAAIEDGQTSRKENYEICLKEILEQFKTPNTKFFTLQLHQTLSSEDNKKLLSELKSKSEECWKWIQNWMKETKP